jgi:hypothetical protein
MVYRYGRSRYLMNHSVFSMAEIEAMKLFL